MPDTRNVLRTQNLEKKMPKKEEYQYSLLKKAQLMSGGERVTVSMIMSIPFGVFVYMLLYVFGNGGNVFFDVILSTLSYVLFALYLLRK